MNDPWWATKSKPVLAFLDRPRSWIELDAHMRKLRMSQNVFNNCLAWLEDQKLAYSYQTDRGVFWMGQQKQRTQKADPLLEDLIRQGLVEVVGSPPPSSPATSEPPEPPPSQPLEPNR